MALEPRLRYWNRWVGTTNHGVTGPGSPLTDVQFKQDRRDSKKNPAFHVLIDEEDTYLIIANVGDPDDPFVLTMLYRRIE